MYNLSNIKDPKNIPYIYNKLVNRLMYDGKKTLAEKIVKNTLIYLEKESNVDPYKTFLLGIENASPFLEVRSIRLGAARHFVPVPVKPKRQISFSLKWLVDSARNQTGNNISENLANEILLASQDKGSAVKKCKNLHSLAMANRAYSNFRWQ